MPQGKNQIVAKAVGLGEMFKLTNYFSANIVLTKGLQMTFSNTSQSFSISLSISDVGLCSIKNIPFTISRSPCW